MSPRCMEQACIVYCKHGLVLKAEKVYHALGNTFSEKGYVLRVVVSIFKRDFNNEYLLNLYALGDSGEGARSNPINEVKARHITVETFSLRWFPVKPLIKLRFGEWAVDFSRLRQSEHGVT